LGLIVDVPAIARLNNMLLNNQQIHVGQYKTKQEVCPLHSLICSHFQRNKELELNFTNCFVKHLPASMDQEGLNKLVLT
jgi:hypothetical protein